MFAYTLHPFAFRYKHIFLFRVSYPVSIWRFLGLTWHIYPSREWELGFDFWFFKFHFCWMPSWSEYRTEFLNKLGGWAACVGKEEVEKFMHEETSNLVLLKRGKGAPFDEPLK